MQKVGALSITDAIPIHAGMCVALVGGGGKTTTMFAIAQCLREPGRKILVTTTTRIWPPQDVPLVCGGEVPKVLKVLERRLRDHGVVALGGHIGPDGKLHGIAPELVCEVLRRGAADVILCEADGSAGRSLKAYGPAEPVIPPCASLVLVVAGIDAVGKCATSEVVHRPELFCRLLGVPPGAPLEPVLVARAMVELARPAPLCSRVVHVLNKVEGRAARESAEAVAAELGNRHSRVEVLLLSRGKVIASYHVPDVRSRTSAG